VVVAPRGTPARRLEKALERAGDVDKHVAHEKEERRERRNVGVERGDEDSDFANDGSDKNRPSRLAGTRLSSCNGAQKRNNAIAGDALKEPRRACQTLQAWTENR
jgi:hypothetical protein